MIRLSSFVLAAISGLFAVSPAWGIMINIGQYSGVQVGERDEIITQSSSISDLADQLAFVSLSLGTSYQSLIHTAPVDWWHTDETDVIAFQLVGDTGYFLASNASEMVLLRNVSSANWGVLDLSQLGGSLVLDSSMQLAFVSEFGSFQATPVPEPLTLSLLGFGLAGIALSRRRAGGPCAWVRRQLANINSLPAIS